MQLREMFVCITDVNVSKNGNHSSYFPENVGKFNLGKRTREATFEWSKMVAGETAAARVLEDSIIPVF